jgi:threonine synthase
MELQLLYTHAIKEHPPPPLKKEEERPVAEKHLIHGPTVSFLFCY